MNSFWPKGLSLSDTQSPYDVLESAREEWETNSEGVLTLAIQRTDSQNGKAIIIVHAKHVPSKRTATLFSVIHRLNEPYPVTIQPRKDDLPNLLKKSYYAPGIADFVAPLQAKGGPVTNRWVSDTPSEFREKLVEALNLSVIKTAILSLASGAPSDILDDNHETIQD